jgi:alanyl aminopeptidase
VITIRPFALLALAIAALAQQTPAPPAFRLGDTVVPVRYSAELTVVPEKDDFSGVIDIDLIIRQSTQVIWLNANGLTVERASLDIKGQTLTARPVPQKADFVGFAFDQPVAPGPAKLHIAYRGLINSRASAGLFKNKVGDDWYVYTQFESTDARSAFPCFDEPSFKVPWQITLRVKPGDMALSNTPELSETESGGMKVVRFAETRPLPSYLVAMAVGPFEAVDAGKAGSRQVPLRIITPRGMADRAKYAAEVTPQLLTVLENYFGIPYQYPKLDSIAVPLFGGAMENPGLITYGETLILAKPSEDTLSRQRGFASVAAHEMAHLWFGDLVTMAWWDDLWLNEAFATWMSEKVLEQWKPEWHTDVTDAASRQAAMGTDSLVSARKIRQPIVSKDDIANAFDNITYGKGAAVIYMFEHWIGPDVFQKGVRRYLTQHADGNATARDFLAAQTAAAGRDIAPAFSTFLDQAGVPFLTVDLNCAGQTPRLALQQRRFLPLGSKPPAPQVWQIPVCARWEGGRECVLFTQDSGAPTLNTAQGCPAWLMLNAGQAGYYRSLYGGGMLSRLLADNGKHLSAIERVGVLGDVRALMRGGELPAAEALNIVPEFANDPTRQVVSTTIGIVESIGFNLVPENLRPNYQRFIRKVYGARAHELGWTAKPGESDDVRLLRPQIVSLVANEGEDPDLIAQARDLANKWLVDRAAVQPDMVGVVLDTAAQHSGRELYDRLLAELRKTKDRRLRGQILNAMGSFRDPAIVKANFNLLLSGEIDPREGLGLLFGPLGDPKTRALPFELVRANYDQLSARLPTRSDADYRAFLPTVAEAFCDAGHRNEVEAFFKDRAPKTVGGPRILSNTLEQIDQCVAIRKAQEPSAEAFLRQY